MANYIVKIAPELDAYVYWNTTADCPLYGGTREELSVFLNRTGEDVDLDDRFERADKTGTSAKPPKGTNDPGFYAWAEPGDFIAQQRGLVERGDLMELWRCAAVDRPYPHILKPFEDGHMVGWSEAQLQGAT